eukprot:10331470-Alexandrium_andersonii.AAC.1
MANAGPRGDGPTTPAGAPTASSTAGPHTVRASDTLDSSMSFRSPPALAPAAVPAVAGGRPTSGAFVHSAQEPTTWSSATLPPSREVADKAWRADRF